MNIELKEIQTRTVEVKDEHVKLIRQKLYDINTTTKENEWLDPHYDKLKDLVKTLGYSERDANDIVDWFDDDEWDLHSPDYPSWIKDNRRKYPSWIKDGDLPL